MFKQDDTTLIFKEVFSEPLLVEVKHLFREYQQSIDTDLCFQKFEEELKTLPGKYIPPKGRLYLLYKNKNIAGCAALRELDNNSCEMKRLYVRPEYRGKGYGRALACKIILESQKIGYKKIFLDTLISMKEAVKLYKSLGFKQSQPYCFNPISDALYMFMDL